MENRYSRKPDTPYTEVAKAGVSLRKGQGRIGLAVKQTLGTQTIARPPEFISDRLLKVTLDLRGRAKGLFVCSGPD